MLTLIKHGCRLGGLMGQPPFHRSRVGHIWQKEIEVLIFGFLWLWGGGGGGGCFASMLVKSTCMN